MNTRNTIITAILTSMLTSIITFFGLDYLKSRRWTETKTGEKEVPLILGLTEAQAESVLRQQDLKLSIIEKKPSEDFQAGAVSVQSPVKGAMLPPGSVVSAVLSTGPPREHIPDIIGKPLAEATRRLAEEGFRVGTVTKKENPEIPKDHVSTTTPQAGAKAETGTTVHLVLSTGAGTIEVPRLVGRYYGAAKKEILEAGFELGQVRWADNFDRDSFVILRQSPEPGTEARTGTKIDITVNRGD